MKTIPENQEEPDCDIQAPCFQNLDLLPNLLLIAGTGRDSGKTTMGCAIIRKFGISFPIIAVKISPHFNKKAQDLVPIHSGENLFIAEEVYDSKPRDSSRMLAAGARKSFFVMSHDDQLTMALQRIISLTDHNDLIVCESGGLRNIVTPGLFFMMNANGNEVLKPDSNKFKGLCDRWITFDGKQFDFSLNSLDIQNNRWILAENA